MIVINYLPIHNQQPYTSIIGLVNEAFDIVNDSIAIKEAIDGYQNDFMDSTVYEICLNRNNDTNELEIVLVFEKELNEHQTNFIYSKPKEPKPKSKYPTKMSKRVEEIKKLGFWKTNK